jgi:hypothetical protein
MFKGVKKELYEKEKYKVKIDKVEIKDPLHGLNFVI